MPNVSVTGCVSFVRGQGKITTSIVDKCLFTPEVEQLKQLISTELHQFFV